MSGRKTLEVRVGYNNIKKIIPGQKIELSTHSRSKVVDIKDVRKYRTFQAMLENENPSLIIPDANKKEVFEILTRIYPKSRERLGVIVLELGI